MNVVAKSKDTAVMVFTNRHGETYVESYADRQSMLVASLKIADTVGMEHLGVRHHDVLQFHVKFLRGLAMTAAKIANEVEDHVVAEAAARAKGETKQ